MEIERRETNDIVVLDVNGEIDLYNAPEIKELINKLIEEQKYNVIINLDRVSYIDSSGIGALISSLSIRSTTGSIRSTRSSSRAA